MAGFWSRLFGRKEPEHDTSGNAAAIARLLVAAQRGVDALSEAALTEQLVCGACGDRFMAALGMKTGGRSTIVCPKCNALVYQR